MGPQLDPFEKSVMLLVLTEDAIRRRRYFEQACGYSEDYGNDNVIIKAIQNHLKTKEIQPIVTRVVEIIKLSNDEKKARENNDSI